MKVIEATIKSFKYENDTKETLKEINLNIEEGELVVITGLSGCGKTTLTRVLNGLVPHHYGGNLIGEVKLLGQNILDYRKGEIAKHIGNVFQNPSDQFFATVAEDEVAFVGENLGMEYEVLKERTKQAFREMKIDNLLDKKLSELSGGQKQKVAIASTLIYDTKIIFFDEPSSNLDFQGIAQFVEIIKDLKKMGKTLVIVEHRLFYLRDLYDRLLYMKNGRVVKEFGKGRLTEVDCKENNLRSINYENLVSENATSFKEKTEEINKLNISIGKRTLIENLSFELHRNEIMAIVGANGIGKTTLARTLAGLIKSKGSISFGAYRWERLKNAYYMMQDVDYQIFFDTVENELIPKNRLQDDNYLVQVKNYLEQIDLWDKRLEHPQNLSGGEKQRLSLATSFLSERKVIILDEPTSGLDYKRMAEISTSIRDYAKYHPVIIITHDLELIFKTCNTILMLNKDSFKKIKTYGNEKAILNFLTNESLYEEVI